MIVVIKHARLILLLSITLKESYGVMILTSHRVAVAIVPINEPNRLQP